MKCFAPLLVFILRKWSCTNILSVVPGHLNQDVRPWQRSLESQCGSEGDSCHQRWFIIKILSPHEIRWDCFWRYVLMGNDITIKNYKTGIKYKSHLYPVSPSCCVQHVNTHAREMLANDWKCRLVLLGMVVVVRRKTWLHQPNEPGRHNKSKGFPERILGKKKDFPGKRMKSR